MRPFLWKLLYLLFGRIDPTPLHPRLEALRAVDLEPTHQLPSLVQSIDERYLHLRDNSHVFRNLFLAPAALAWSLLAAYFIWERISMFRAAQVQWVAEMDQVVARYGVQYIENLLARPDRAGNYPLIFHDRYLDWWEYHNSLYFGIPGRYGWLVGDIVTLVMVFIPAVLLVLWLLLWRPGSGVMFDRNQQVVVGWNKGKLFAQRWADLSVLETPRGLQFLLRGEDARDEFGWRRFIVQPTDLPTPERADKNAYILALIVKFMEHGRSTVCQNDTHKAPSFALRYHIRPAPYEARLAALLTQMPKGKFLPT